MQFELSMRMGCHSARSSREEWRRRRSPKIEHDLESRSYSGEYFDRFQDDLSFWAALSHRRGAVFAGINRGPQGRDSLTGRASPTPPPSPSSTSSRSAGPEGGGRGPLRLRLKTPWVQPGKPEPTHTLSPHHPLRCATTALAGLGFRTDGLSPCSLVPAVVQAVQAAAAW